jgi:hypothetical protein
LLLRWSRVIVASDYCFGNSHLTPIRAAIGNPNCNTGVAAV